jgi:hypothetical protein
MGEWVNEKNRSPVVFVLMLVLVIVIVLVIVLVIGLRISELGLRPGFSRIHADGIQGSFTHSSFCLCGRCELGVILPPLRTRRLWM